jgi:four helix bundle protein
MPLRTQFDHEKLEAYQLQLLFIGWFTDLCEELRDSKPRRIAETLDQLDRSSLSVLLNMAEGNGRRPSRQRVRFFDDARGSATECAACLDALVSKRAAHAERVVEGKTLLLRVVSILCKLIARFEQMQDGAEKPESSSRSRSRITRTSPP